MTTGGFETRRSYLDPACLFFSISKLVSFKKLNRGDGDEKIHKLASYTFYFIFILKFNFLYLFFYFYYIIINIFHKNKNIMNFYKLFIKKIS